MIKKILLWASSLFFLALLIAGIWGYLQRDWILHKGAEVFREQLAQNTGIEVQHEEISLGLSPLPYLDITKPQFRKNTSWQFAAERAKVEFSLRSLWKRKPHLYSLQLLSPKLTLASTAFEKSKQEAESQDTGKTPGSFSLEHLSFDNAHITIATKEKTPFIISKASGQASIFLSQEGFLLQNIKLSAPSLGLREAQAKELRIDTNNFLRVHDLRIGGSRSHISGSCSGASVKNFSCEMQAREFDLRELQEAVSLFGSPEKSGLSASGVITGPIQIGTQHDELQFNTSLVIRDSHLRSPWISYDKGQGKLFAQGSSQDWKLRGEDMQVSPPASQARIKNISFSYSKNGNYTFQAEQEGIQKQELLRLAPVLDKLLQGYDLSGRLDARITGKGKSAKFEEGHFQFTAHGSTLRLPKHLGHAHPLRDIRGDIELRYAQDALQLILPKPLHARPLPESDEQITLQTSGIRFDKMQGELMLEMPSVPLHSLATLSPSLQESLAHLQAKGNLTGSLRIKLAGKEFPRINGTLRFSEVRVPTVDSELRVPDLTAQLSSEGSSGTEFSFQKTDAFFRNEKISLSGQGQITSQGLHFRTKELELAQGTGELRLENSFGSPRVRTELQMKDMRAEELTKFIFATERPRELFGRIPETSIQFSINELGETNADLRTKIVDGELRNFNLGRAVLDKIGSLPVIGMNLLMRIPSEFASVVQGEHTKIVDSTLIMRLHKQTLHFDRLHLASNWYGIDGQARFTKKDGFIFDGAMLLDQALSNSLIGRINILSLFLTPSKILSLPFQLTVKDERILVLPDPRGLLSRGGVGAIREGMGKVVGSILGGSRRKEKTGEGIEK